MFLGSAAVARAQDRASSHKVVPAAGPVSSALISRVALAGGLAGLPATDWAPVAPSPPGAWPADVRAGA